MKKIAFVSVSVWLLFFKMSQHFRNKNNNSIFQVNLNLFKSIYYKSVCSCHFCVNFYVLNILPEQEENFFTTLLSKIQEIKNRKLILKKIKMTYFTKICKLFYPWLYTIMDSKCLKNLHYDIPKLRYRETIYSRLRDQIAYSIFVHQNHINK